MSPVRAAGAQLSRIAGRAEQLNAPLSALFELTGRCNLDCGHCYLDIANPPRELSTEEALRVVDELADAGTLFLTLTGGELVLRKDALVVAAHARKRGLALRLFTNATRITRTLAAEIARVRPLGVEVSIYGTHGAGHDAVTRRHALRRTLRGVLLLKRAGVPVGLKAPVLAGVARELDAIVRLARRIGAPIAFDPFVTPRHDGQTAPTALRAETEALAEALRHPVMGLGTALPPPLELEQAPCAIARRTTRIDPSGNVFPCPTYPEAAGNLLERSFQSIWREAPLLQRLRRVRMKDLTGACAGCAQSGYCGRCSAVARIEHGDELGPSYESCRVAEAKEIAIEGTRRGPPRRPPLRLRVLG